MAGFFQRSALHAKLDPNRRGKVPRRSAPQREPKPGGGAASRPAPCPTPSYDFEQVAAELVRALRGKRSQVAFSHRLGYASSVVHRWEARKSWPTASRFFAGCQRLGIDVDGCIEGFFQQRPEWLGTHRGSTPEGVLALLRQLKGKTPLVRLARDSGRSRHALSRWLRGHAEPSLPELLRFVEAASRRLLDFLATLVSPSQLPSMVEPWQRLEQMRRVAYEFPLSHGVLRALEVKHTGRDQMRWLMKPLVLTQPQVTRALDLLSGTGQINLRRGVCKVLEVRSVNTGRDP